MIKRILIVIVILFALAFIVVWVLGGGFQNIKAAVNHYRNPFQYHSVIDYFFQIGSTTGETFKLPGTPSSYPALTMPTEATSTSYQSGTPSPDGTGY